MPFGFNPFKTSRRRSPQVAAQAAEATPEQEAEPNVGRNETDEAGSSEQMGRLFSTAQQLLSQARSGAQGTDSLESVRNQQHLQQIVKQMAELVACMHEAKRGAWQMQLQMTKDAMDALTPAGAAAPSASSAAAYSVGRPSAPPLAVDTGAHSSVSAQSSGLTTTQRRHQLQRDLESQRAMMLEYEKSLGLCHSWGGPGEYYPLSVELEPGQSDMTLIADIEHLEAQRSVHVLRNRSRDEGSSSRDEATWQAEAIAATRHAELRTQLMFLTGSVKKLKGYVEELRKGLSEAEQQLQQSEQSAEAIKAELRTLLPPPPPQYTKLERNRAAALSRTR